MPVDTTSPEYDNAAPDWRIMRDVLGGARAVKAGAASYLPRLSEQTPEDYNSYKDRAQFFNATSRTLESLKGFVFRKDPQMLFPAEMAPFMDDATMTGISFYDYAKGTLEEVLGVGRVGTLIEWDGSERRPFFVRYRAEDIINWKVERVAGHMVVTMVVLHELDPEWIPLTEDQRAKGPPDEYEQGQYDQWRIYRLQTDDAGEPYVTITVYRRKDERKGSKDDPFVIVKQAVPTRRGVSLHRIPFVFHGPNNGLTCVEKPPLLDLADVNLSHYRTSADLENGRHFTGLPTPYACGFETKNKFRVGSTVAWVTEEANAKVGFLEFTGQGLKALETAIEQKERQMAALGARMLQPEAKKAEAFDTVAMRSAAETSALMNATIACTQTLSDTLEWVGWWIGTAAEPEELSKTHGIELNSEFTIARMDAQMLAELTAAYLGGAIDLETYHHNLEQGELLPAGRTVEEMRTSIDDNPPGLPEPTLPGGGAGAGGA